MECPALETLRAAGVQAPSADLSSLAAWRSQDCAQTPTTGDDLLGGQVPRRAEGDAGQSGQEDRRGGRRESPHPAATTRPRPVPAPLPHRATDAPGLDPQAGLDGAAAAG